MLANKLYQNLDQGKIIELVQQYLNTGKEVGDFLGEGIHFSAWKMKGVMGFPLVVKIQTESFLSRSGYSEKEKWKNSVKKLENAGLVLPCEIWEISGHMVIVTLFGSLVRTTPSLMIQFDHELENLGLLIHDHMQFVEFEGQTYLLDVSDLKDR